VKPGLPVSRSTALLAASCFGVFCATAEAQSVMDPAQAFEQENYLEVIRLLSAREPDPAALRILALSYFHEGDFDQARPQLERALETAPTDLELNVALLDVLLADRNYGRAGQIADRLQQLGAGEAAAFGYARIALANGERARAIDLLRSLVNEAEAPYASRAADILIEVLYEEHEYGEAYEVAQTALQREPESPFVYRFARIRPDPTASSQFSADLAYRLVYDDNLTFPDDPFGSGKEDFGHVLTADLLYQRPFGKTWHFYAQGHALQSFYNDLDEFNQTRLTGSVGIGQQGERLGWLVPLEVDHDRVDGDAYRTSAAALPGVNLQIGRGYATHVFVRLQSDDYQDSSFAEEDRSGSVTGAGAVLLGQLSPRLQLRTYVEFNRYDTDGVYWERDELVGFLFGEFEITSRWMVGLAMRYSDEDYDNARPAFAERQQDESTEFYLVLTHRFSNHWRWRGQVSHIDHKSNIPIFDYERNVYSFSVAWEF
jgi:tetratricopeptide (TPR) repeat protein